MSSGISNSLDVTNLEPPQRQVNTIFQNYALFPHMTVKENISKEEAEEIKAKLEEAGASVEVK